MSNSKRYLIENKDKTRNSRKILKYKQSKLKLKIWAILTSERSFGTSRIPSWESSSWKLLLATSFTSQFWPVFPYILLPSSKQAMCTMMNTMVMLKKESSTLRLRVYMKTNLMDMTEYWSGLYKICCHAFMRYNKYLFILAYCLRHVIRDAFWLFQKYHKMIEYYTWLIYWLIWFSKREKPSLCLNIFGDDKFSKSGLELYLSQ